jgi:hypothetical protein
MVREAEIRAFEGELPRASDFVHDVVYRVGYRTRWLPG